MWVFQQHQRHQLCQDERGRDQRQTAGRNYAHEVCLDHVPAAALGFVLQYALGANATFSLSAVLTAMFSTHVLIGIGEAIITVLSVTAVMASRPDLVYGFRGAKAQLEIRKA